jgi:transketolase
MRILGIEGQFAPTGSASYLLDHFGLNTEGIVQAARDVIGSGRA